MAISAVQIVIARNEVTWQSPGGGLFLFVFIFADCKAIAARTLLNKPIRIRRAQ
jgi:hypothetical protein